MQGRIREEVILFKMFVVECCVQRRKKVLENFESCFQRILGSCLSYFDNLKFNFVVDGNIFNFFFVGNVDNFCKNILLVDIKESDYIIGENKKLLVEKN